MLDSLESFHVRQHLLRLDLWDFLKALRMKELPIIYSLILLDMLQECGIQNDRISEVAKLPLELLEELTNVNRLYKDRSVNVYHTLLNASDELRQKDADFNEFFTAYLQDAIEEGLNTLRYIDVRVKT
nr:MAG TPA: hypothetical protein [Bacteriophage sp.]